MQYWKVGNSVESHSFPHKVPRGKKITKEEFDKFIAGLPMPEPVDYIREASPLFTDFEDRIALLEAKVKHLMESDP